MLPHAPGVQMADIPADFPIPIKEDAEDADPDKRNPQQVSWDDTSQDSWLNFWLVGEILEKRVGVKSHQVMTQIISDLGNWHDF